MSRFFVRFYPILLALFLAAAIFLARANAFAAEQIGAACGTLGVSTMAQDRKNLIVCLENDAGSLVWKSMTSAKASGVPVGAIIAWPVVNNPPDMQNADGSFNWLDCNGQGVPKTLYPELFAVIGGVAPDLRGLFLRGVGGNSAALGLDQGDAIRNIEGQMQYVLWVYNTAGKGAFKSSRVNNSYKMQYTSSISVGSYELNFDASQSVPTANENRPVNRAVRYLIRARS